MNKIIVITGPGGVGKSTQSKLLVEEFDKVVLIEGDKVYHLIKKGAKEPWNDETALELCWENIISIISNSLKKGYDVILDYICFKEDIDRIRAAFSSNSVIPVVLVSNPSVLAQRDSNRSEDSQLGDICLERLNEFLESYLPEECIDTTNLTINEALSEIKEKVKKFK